MASSAVFEANRTALITGGASGVGFAFAQLCQKHGMNVGLVDKNTEELAKAKEVLVQSATNGQRIEVYDMVMKSDCPFCSSQTCKQKIVTDTGVFD
jgi:NAD(P)-dependent dehydrogenase (short-subunit alcohol dehydrogenase family)